jgi:hypothetical protein
MIVYAVVDTHEVFQSTIRVYQNYDDAYNFIISKEKDDYNWWTIETFDTITGQHTGVHYIDGYSNFDEI